MGYASAGGFAAMLGYSSGTANTGGTRDEPRGVVHGQEAVIPLPSGSRVPVMVQGASSGNVYLAVNNYGEPADVSTKQTVDGNGDRHIEVMLQRKIQDEVTRPSAKTNRSLRATYQLNPGVIKR